MNEEILKTLFEYIDATIEEKLDDMQSSDAGLITFIRKDAAKQKLEILITEKAHFKSDNS